MVHNVFSRLLSLMTVLTLLVLAASATLQPEAALASPGVTADLLDSGSSLTNEWDNNGDDNGNEWDDNGNNDNEWDNNGSNGNNNGNEWDDNGDTSGNEWDDGGDNTDQGILFAICAMPWYVNHPACTGGFLGAFGG